MSRKHYNLLVKGKVQGVYYRVSAERKAKELGLHGIVQNLPTGDVYVEAEGDEQLLNEFVQWCKIGPPRARVTEVQVMEANWKDYKDFWIKRGA